ncbi:MAG TPA: hypothetical protein VIM57_01175 [Luteolibacter sp.]
MKRRKLIRALRPNPGEAWITAPDQTAMVGIEGSDKAPRIFFICPDASPNHRRLVVVRHGGIGDFRIVRGPLVVEAIDVAAEMLLTDGIPSLSDFVANYLPKDHPLSQVTPSLDHLADLIAKGGPLA